MSGPVVIIVIGAPPPPPKNPNRVQEIPAVGTGNVADILRDAADALDGKEPA